VDTLSLPSRVAEPDSRGLVPVMTAWDVEAFSLNARDTFASSRFFHQDLAAPATSP
jgi:hypothetical protein